MKFLVPILLLISVSLFNLEAKTTDPYKVLGVDQKASQRDIQKAFHKLSLKYHPDKNKEKGAQRKFEQINNAYEILSDEVKRKNYDTNGDEKGNLGFNARYPGDQGPGNSQFNFRPDEWQNMDGPGGSQSFSFSFGKPSGNSFGSGLNDIFSNFFGGASQFGGFGGSTRSQSRSKSSSLSLKDVNSQVFKKEVVDQGYTWLLLSYTSMFDEIDSYQSVIEEVGGSLKGALKVGSINCKTELSFCKDLGIYPRRTPRVFVYSYRGGKSGSLVEYTDDLAVRSMKMFCNDQLPRFSERVDLSSLEVTSDTPERLPRVLLLSTKTNTPVIWRALSGLYRNHFIFYDAEVHHVSDPMVKELGIDALPAIVGWLANGEKHILKTGIITKDLKSTIRDISKLLDGLEMTNKKAGSTRVKSSEAASGDKQIPQLTQSNFDALCGERTPVCIIGSYRSSKGRERLESILSMVSQKSLSRRHSTTSGSRDSISYSMLDVTKQPTFLDAFDKSKLKQDNFLVAYKPRKGKFAAFLSEITVEEVEMFVGSVLNGDVHFSKTRQKPTIK